MQEDLEQRTVTLIISTARFSERTVRWAIGKYLSYREHSRQEKQRNKEVTPHGKQTVKELLSQGQGAASIEAEQFRLPAFDRVARKYGVDYAVRKDGSKHLIFFKARDADALNAAFKEYSAKEISREDRKESVLATLARLTALLRDRSPEKLRNKERDLSL